MSLVDGVSLAIVGAFALQGNPVPVQGVGGANFCNDGKDLPGGNNAVWFKWQPRSGGAPASYGSPNRSGSFASMTRIFVKAKTAIKKGDFIHVSYQKDYWKLQQQERERRGLSDRLDVDVEDIRHDEPPSQASPPPAGQLERERVERQAQRLLGLALAVPSGHVRFVEHHQEQLVASLLKAGNATHNYQGTQVRI